MTMRRIAALTGFLLAAFVVTGCATATIEDAVPAGALVQSPAESPTPAMTPAQAAIKEAAIAAPPAGTYPNLNVAPMAAAPQISEGKKASDRAELRARQTQIAAEGQRHGVSGDAAALGAQARDRVVEAQGNTMPDDTDALRRLADRHIEETLKQIEGR